VACLAAVILASRLAAQDPAPLAAAPRTLVGVAVDTAGRPVDSVEVRLDATSRRMLTGADGVFRFEGLPPARYTVMARKVGYIGASARVVVGSAGASVRIRLTTFTRGLPPVVTTARTSGLGGVVSDTAKHPLGDVEITVLGSSQRTTTDSSGAFFLDVKPGTYMVDVQRDGYKSQLVSVHVPDNAGRRIAVWLADGRDAARGRRIAARQELQRRLDTMSAAFSQRYSREDLAKFTDQTLERVATTGGGRRVGDACMVIVDGEFRAPAWSLSAADLEFVEVYAPRPVRQPARSLTATAMMPRENRDDPCNSTTVYAWIRK
jgi:hypothetical protein